MCEVLKLQLLMKFNLLTTVDDDHGTKKMQGHA